MTDSPLNVPTPPHMDEDELRLFATSVGRFLDEHAGPDKRQQWREDRVVERALWHKAGAAGLLCSQRRSRQLRHSQLRVSRSQENTTPTRGFSPGYRPPVASPTIAAGKYPSAN